MTEKVSAHTIKKALADKHHKEFFITECKNGPTHYSRNLLQVDAVAIYKSWSSPLIRGYEIKVSRGDFLKDAKYSQYLQYCHEFYFVTPSGMVQRQEVEDPIGLMWYNPKTGGLTTKKKAVYRKIEISADMLMYIIMNRLDSDRYPFHSDKADYFREWLERKISNKELGCRVRCRLLDEIREKEKELRALGLAAEIKGEYEAILAVMRKHGVSVWHDQAKALDEALALKYPVALVNDIERHVRAMSEKLGEIKGDNRGGVSRE